MSDYYGLPISIPPGIQVPNVSNLYATQLAQQLGGAGALPRGAGVGASELASLYGSGASGASGAGGFLSGLTSGLSGEATPLIAGGRAGLFRAALPAGAGYLATQGINSVLPSTGQAGNVRQVLGDAATGAGIGGTVGLLGGPFAGISVPAGAAIGGALGGAYGLAQDLFGGSDKDTSNDDYKNTISSAATQFGLNPNNYTAAFDLLTKAGADPKTLTTQLAQQLIQDGQAKQQQDQAIQVQQQQHASDQQFALAIQTQAAKFFTPYVNNIISAGQAQSELLKGQAQNLPAPYRDVFLNQAQQALSESQRLAGAYAAQAAGLPGQYMYSADLKRQQQLAQLQYQQSVVNAQQGGGGGADFQALLAQQAG